MNKYSFINVKNIFLIDGLGAAWSTVLSGLILPFFSDLLGIPNIVLYGLAAIAFFYGCFSLSIHIFIKKYRPEFLLAIIIGNITYCILTTALIFTLPTISWIGQFVLISEIIAISTIVFFEIKLFQQPT